MENVLISGPELPGILDLPTGAIGLVAFIHGSGSSRFSARNQFVARVLHSYKLGTLQFDLLTEDEALYRRNVFDIDLLGQRVLNMLGWLDTRFDPTRTPIGLFGASTGAAAALLAAARMPARIAAIVSRGGRPDLAGKDLANVQAPTLLIVGSEDHEVLSLNEAAMRFMSCRTKLEIVPGATHLFEEPGALDTVASLAGHWFENHFLTCQSVQASQ